MLQHQIWLIEYACAARSDNEVELTEAHAEDEEVSSSLEAFRLLNRPLCAARSFLALSINCLRHLVQLQEC